MWKFEHVLAVILLVVLSVAMFVAIFQKNQELTITFGGALTTAFSGIVAFFFTKHNPNDKNDGGGN